MHQVVPVVVPVSVPPAGYTVTIYQDEIDQCPAPVKIKVFQMLREREQYIETLTDVISAHNNTRAGDDE